MSPLDNAEFEAPVPPAVRRASKRADEIAREVGSANVPDDTPPEDPPVDDPPPEDPPADDPRR
jgi:hypothetical protein